MSTSISPRENKSKFFHAAESAFDIVAVASSAGGLNALKILLSGIPDKFPGAFVIVQHLAPSRPSQMVDILKNKTGLIVKEASQGAFLAAHTAFLAPPDAHVLVTGEGKISLTHTAQVNFVRPSADLLFESLAKSYRSRVIGVVLTGKGTDGTNGIKAIKRSGGIVIAQDEASSDYFDMPSSAIRTGCVDYILPLDKISPTILDLFTGASR